MILQVNVFILFICIYMYVLIFFIEVYIKTNMNE